MVNAHRYPDLSALDARSFSPLRQPAEQVWVLTGSIGALKATRRFFRCLHDDLPVAFVIAIRIPQDGLALAVNLFARDTGCRVYGAEPGRTLCQRDIVLAPADQPMRLGSDGRFEPASSDSAAPEPSIDQTLQTIAQGYRRHAGAIIFSGIGMEGVQGCQAIADQGGQVWTQDSDSCQFDSMPDYIRSVCDVSYCAAPELLAARLHEHVAEASGAAAPFAGAQGPAPGY